MKQTTGIKRTVTKIKDSKLPVVELLGCCCLSTPLTLASGGVWSSRLWSIWPALWRGLSTNPGVTTWCTWMVQMGHSGDGCDLTCVRMI